MRSTEGSVTRGILLAGAVPDSDRAGRLHPRRLSSARTAPSSRCEAWTEGDNRVEPLGHAAWHGEERCRRAQTRSPGPPRRQPSSSAPLTPPPPTYERGWAWWRTCSTSRSRCTPTRRRPRASKPISFGAWAQYLLDNFATVEEAVAGNRERALLRRAGDVARRPCRHRASLDQRPERRLGGLRVCRRQAQSSIIGRQYQVMTNSPAYDQQLALNAYWKQIGG